MATKRPPPVDNVIKSDQKHLPATWGGLISHQLNELT